MNALEPTAIFTGAPRSPFVSPDGQWTGFVDANQTVKKIAVTGGPAETLGTIQGTAPRGGAWGPGDAIVIAA